MARPARMDYSPADGRPRIRLEGDLTLATTAPLWRELGRLEGRVRPEALDVDLSGVGECDTAGAALVLALRDDLARHCQDVRFVEASGQVAALLEMAGRSCEAPADEEPSHEVSLGLVDTVGDFTLRSLRNVRTTLEYVGALTAGLASLPWRRDALRWRDFVHYLCISGADAVGIIALVNLLVGVIIAFQSVAQLSPYGLETYMPEFVAISIATELGPLMTAIILAGRSGSGFAAEIGTMKVNEEVDALETMGLDRTRFLVLPKVLALLAAMPLLITFANLCGIVGGLLIGLLSLDHSLASYVEETMDSLTVWGVTKGLVKGEAYALVVAAVGCLRGLQTRRGAQGVGRSATSAVVSGVFLIICVDAVLTVFFHYWDAYRAG